MNSGSTTSDDARSDASGLLILGMHRSGTSCLAGMLQSSGFHAGKVDEWNPSNLKGNRENLTAVLLNDRLLREMNGSWRYPSRFKMPKSQSLVPIKTLMQELDQANAPWFIKDPRTLLTLDAWLKVRSDIAFVGIFRHPLAVARSLSERNKMSINEGIKLWCHYNEALIERAQRYRFPVLLFGDEPAQFCNRVNAALEEVRAQFGKPDLLNLEQSGQFLDPKLIHHEPEIARDIREQLLAECDSTEISARADATWRNLLDIQSPDTANVPELLKQKPKYPSPQTGSEDIEQIDRLIKASSANTNAIRSGIEWFRQREESQQLESWLRNWHERRPKDPLISWELAKLEWANGDKQKALEHGQSALAHAPGWITPILPLANWAYESEQWTLAARLFRSLELLQPSDLAGQAAFSQIYFTTTGRFAEASSKRFHFENFQQDHIVKMTCRLEQTQATQIRVDPANHACTVQALEAYILTADGKRLDLHPDSTNAKLFDGHRYYFDTNDPQIQFNLGEAQLTERDTLHVRFEMPHRNSQAMKQLNQRLAEIVLDIENAQPLANNQAEAALAELQDALTSSFNVSEERSQTAVNQLRKQIEVTKGVQKAIDTRLVGIKETLDFCKNQALNFQTAFEETPAYKAEHLALKQQHQKAESRMVDMRAEVAHLHKQNQLLTTEASELNDKLVQIKQERSQLLAGSKRMQGSLAARWKEVAAMTEYAEKVASEKQAEEEKNRTLTEKLRRTQHALAKHAELTKTIGRSLSGRLGNRVSRLLMAPQRLGFGPTSLDELEQLRQELGKNIEVSE